MAVSGSLNDTQLDALSDVYIALLVLSITGSLSVLVVSIVKWRHLRDQVHLLVQLASADLCAALILMLASVMNKLRADTGNMCQYILPLSLTFYFISFLLVVVYAWKSKNAIQGWRERATDDEQSMCRRKLVAISIYPIVWLIPLVFYFAYVLFILSMKTDYNPILTNKSENETIQNNSTHCKSCILFLHIWKTSCSVVDREGESVIHHDSQLDTFIRTFLCVVVIFVMISCSFLYCKVGKWYERRTRAELFPVEGDGLSRRRFKKVFATARNMVLVILFCWTPALSLILLSFWTSTIGPQQHFFWLYVLQAVTVSLQGLLNSMVYAWRRTNFTEAVLGENTPLVGYNDIPFYDESLPS